MLCQPSTSCLQILAPAKLNLFLRVVRRREDGFHDIETVMTAINVFDTLQFEPCASSEITLTVMMSAPRNKNSVPITPIPTGADNLVIRAARLLKEYAKATGGARITLVKRIPAAAGMGGGSSDAAATLAGLNRLWGLGCSRQVLMDLAGQLGSDIGFFLGKSSTALCRGRGELIEPLALPNCLHFVVARPESGLSTPKVYQHCRPDHANHDVNQFVQLLRQGGLTRMVRLLHNGLQTPAEFLNDDVRQLRRRFAEQSVLGHQMSGSGTSYYGVCGSSRQAAWVAARLRAAGVPWVQAVRSCS